ncbi:MAG TPA: DUF4112 domain-containing protein [Candidatus Saccharimonadales bacterium]|nr:DUF4112 domain-containing protein [Candidatus Saccharimonadales bacterium]
MAIPLTGEVVGESRRERFGAAERRIKRVTDVLDELVPIPGTGQRVGLDPVIGLIPVVGDVVAAMVGGWVILEATRFGIPRIVVARMLVNLTIDLSLGAIPFLGDLLDIVSRSNSRNLDLFRRHALDPGASTRGQRAFFAGVVLVLIGILWLMAIAIGAVFGWLNQVLM